MGVNNLVQVFDEHYYEDLDGGILEAFGKMFHNNLKIYLYPNKSKDGKIINSENLKLENRMKEFYKFFKYNGKIIDITDFEIKYLDIFSRKVLEMIRHKNNDWEKFLPKRIPEIIKKNRMFGFR